MNEPLWLEAHYPFVAMVLTALPVILSFIHGLIKAWREFKDSDKDARIKELEKQVEELTNKPNDNT